MSLSERRAIARGTYITMARAVLEALADVDRMPPGWEQEGVVGAEAWEALQAVEPWDAGTIEQALRDLVERLGRKPRDVFQPIRVAVTSSCWPRWDANPNTGGPMHQEARARAALNTVFHDAFRPSRIRLPVRAR